MPVLFVWTSKEGGQGGDKKRKEKERVTGWSKSGAVEAFCSDLHATKKSPGAPSIWEKNYITT